MLTDVIKPMQTPNFYPHSLAVKTGANDPLRTSVAHLFSRAQNLPCSTAVQSYVQLVPATLRFSLALEVVFPLLDAPVDLSRRILAAYMLCALYAPHPITINPFHSALVNTFVRERGHAAKIAADGGTGPSEQLVWVLWKILKGDGSDIGPFSPGHLAQSPVPPQLRAANLFLPDEPTQHEKPKFDPFADDKPTLDVYTTPPASISSTSGLPGIHRGTRTDEETERLSQGMALFLAARDRVLTLSEQRILGPLIPQLTSTPLITSHDLRPLIAHNPTLAHPILTALLAQPLIDTYLDVLRHVPPTLPTFDLLGRLLRDTTAVIDRTTGGRTTIADLIRSEVLGWFLHESMLWLDKAQEEEQAGVISDDRFAKGVQNLCRFYNSLVKLSIVDTTSDADTAEMKHFTLRNARIEEANALYRVLAMNTY
ncbi:hypothetical protein PHLGIDRAFT_96635 [Phlebiopsis gigantea 11061_1 CR5-6]|uniref:Uncharacterized protein n=1 Tax=Phlebiopsis gigantea (strain 11061_1 CR5-6) TaxID=745531 RepID=A0A0C3RZH4_PHLG1|nr:hypothetical protein PHLGIDRAFT_96635 [Phlebiopsis gigantea 11061_1 CR5-6]